MMCVCTMCMSAQIATENSKFFDNWSIGVNGGVQTNLHDWNAPQGAVTGITFTKGITPVFSLGFEGQTGWNNLANWGHPEQIHVHNGNVVDHVGVFTTGNVNLMNWFGGYNGKPRVFEIVPFAGVGYGHTFFNESYGNDTDHLLAKAGTSFDFNLGKERAWTLNFHTGVVYDALGKLDCRHATFESTFGVTYHFKNSNNTHYFRTWNVGEMNNQINDLRHRLQTKPTEIIHETVKEVPVIKEITLPAKETLIIGFAFDSSDLSENAKEELSHYAHNHNKAAIVAYSSYEDKTPMKYNQTLSEKRAATVVNYLRERGVEITSIQALGSMNKESNRIAVVTFD